ncbi:uncharacterized protein [Miscanthus floridulus]|uniref:uncharacterized protein n=1 Tax=Miscanthus floridulus TaxID=154761 RepID=UPI00345AB3BC
MSFGARWPAWCCRGEAGLELGGAWLRQAGAGVGQGHGDARREAGVGADRCGARDGTRDCGDAAARAGAGERGCGGAAGEEAGGARLGYGGMWLVAARARARKKNMKA